MGAGTALVTGALGDIGAAIVTELLDDGWRVVATDLHPDLEERSLADRWPPDSAVIYRRLDVTDAAACGEVLRDTTDLRLLVGNAGIVEPQPFVGFTDDVLRGHFEVNVFGNLRLARIAAARMSTMDGDRSIVFTGSWVADRPWPELVAYSATKAALHMAMRTVALEVAPLGIRVNAVAPGIVNAGLARAEAERNPEYARLASRAVPLGRLQEPEDVAHAVSFLASHRARSITGSVILVDGGCSLGSFQ